jgi:hypothetical protein
MTVGIAHTLKMVSEIKGILIGAVDIAKHGIGLGAVKEVFAMLSEVKGIIADAPAILPELKDLDSKEAGVLAEASYDLIKSLVAEIVK